jgi:hypothetical protein
MVAGKFPFTITGKETLKRAERRLVTEDLDHIAHSAMINRLQSNLTLPSVANLARYCCMPETVCPIYPPHRKQTSSLRRAGWVSRLSNTCMPYTNSFVNQMISVLTAAQGLVRYCEQRGIPFVPFNDWASILATVQEIYQNGCSNDVEGQPSTH